MGFNGPLEAEFLDDFHLRSHFYDVIYVIASDPWDSSDLYGRNC